MNIKTIVTNPCSSVQRWKQSDILDNVCIKLQVEIVCGVAQLVARRLAVRQARVRISARHHREVPPLSKQAMKKWREASANGDGWMWLCECMYVCYNNMKNKQKEWHHATKHLEIVSSCQTSCSTIKKIEEFPFISMLHQVLFLGREWCLSHRPGSPVFRPCPQLPAPWKGKNLSKPCPVLMKYIMNKFTILAQLF